MPVQEPSDKQLVVQSEDQKEISETMSGSMVLNFVVLYGVGGSLSQVWSASNALQLIILLGFIHVRLPSCMFTVFQGILEYVQFDLLPSDQAEGVFDVLFKMPHDEPFSGNLE